MRWKHGKRNDLVWEQRREKHTDWKWISAKFSDELNRFGVLRFVCVGTCARLHYHHFYFCVFNRLSACYANHRHRKNISLFLFLLFSHLAVLSKLLRNNLDLSLLPFILIYSEYFSLLLLLFSVGWFVGLFIVSPLMLFGIAFCLGTKCYEIIII